MLRFAILGPGPICQGGQKEGGCISPWVPPSLPEAALRGYLGALGAWVVLVQQSSR